MKEEELVNKLIKEQDLVCYYAVKSQNKSIPILEVYSENPRILYSELGRYLFSHVDILKNFSTNNLFMLLGHYTNNEEAKKQVVNLISERIENENFYCEDVSDSYFMKMVHFSNLSIARVGNENIQKIREQLRDRLQKTKGTEVEEIAKHLEFLSDASNFLTYFEKGVFTKEKITLLEQMLEKDDKALKYVNFGIFQDDIFKLGPEFVQYISKFPDLSTELTILQRHNPRLLKVLENKISSYQNLPDKYEEIEILITYLTRNCFEIELKDINKENIEALTDCAIRASQILGERSTVYDDKKMINVPYSDDYFTKLNAEYDKRYKMADSLEAKKNVYLNKAFSLSINGAKRLLQEYAGDLDNLSNITQEERKTFEELRKIIEGKDEKQIDLLFEQGSKTWSVQDVLKLQQKIAKECALTYTKEMNKFDDRIKGNLAEDNPNITYVEYNGTKVPKVKINGKFDIFVHSTDAGFIRNVELGEDTDFVKMWENGQDKENHVISTAFINQDFLGSAPVHKNGVRYAFTSINEEKIRLMGVTDLNTYSTNFAYSSATKQYMSAKTMPYNSRRVYSEFGVEREGTRPDYVVIYDDDLEEVVNNAYMAASQFGIPVIYIDKKEIEQEQLQNLNSLITQFNDNKDVNILGKLINTYETNVAGWLLNKSPNDEDNSHTGEIDNSRFKEDFTLMWGSIQETINGYINSIKNTKTNQNSAQELMQIMEIMLKEIELYNGCEETKPISKTHISFDAEAIINEVNQAFETIGSSQYKVDLKEIPTLEQYRINMKAIMQNALMGENPITIEDVKQAENAQRSLEETKDNNYDIGEKDNG